MYFDNLFYDYWVGGLDFLLFIFLLQLNTCVTHTSPILSLLMVPSTSCYKVCYTSCSTVFRISDDISTKLQHSRCHLYADLQICAHFRPDAVNEHVDRINIDFASISLWARRFGLRLNAEKTQSIIIGHPRSLSTIDNGNMPAIIMGTTPILIVL